jgi:hypothetical protein
MGPGPAPALSPPPTPPPPPDPSIHPSIHQGGRARRACEHHVMEQFHSIWTHPCFFPLVVSPPHPRSRSCRQSREHPPRPPPSRNKQRSHSTPAGSHHHHYSTTNCTATS